MDIFPKDYIATTEQFEASVDELAKVADFLSVELAAFEVPTPEQAAEVGIAPEDVKPLRGEFFKTILFDEFEAEAGDLSAEEKQDARLGIIQETMQSLMVAQAAVTAAVNVDPDLVIEQIKTLGIHPDPDSVTAESLKANLVVLDDQMQESARTIAVNMTGMTIAEMRERVKALAMSYLDDEEV